MTDRTINWVFRATDKTSQAFRSVDAKLAGITKSLKTFAGFAGFATVATGVGSLTRSLVEMGSELQDASEKLGVSAETLQVLKRAAESTGASFDTLQAALAFNTKLTGEAERGNKKAIETFRLLGIDAKKFADLPIDRRLSVIAQQLSGVDDPARRLDLTLKALGKGGADLAPLLAQGAGGLAKIEEQLRQTNAILSDEQVKALDDAGDAWEAFMLRLKVTGAPVLIGTIDLLTKMGEAASKALENAGNAALVFGQSAAGAATPLKVQRGPQSRGGRRNKPEEESIVGIPGLKSTAAAKESLEKSYAILDGVMEKYQSGLKASREKIQAEVDGITQSTRTPFEAYQEGLQRNQELQDRYGLSAEAAQRNVIVLAEAYADAAGQQYDLSAAGMQANAAFEDTARILASIKTPMEEYTEQLARISELQDQGFLSADQAGKAIVVAAQDYASAQTAISAGNDELSESTKKLLQDIKSAADGFARDFTDIFFDTTQSVGDMFKDLAETIAKALFTQSVSQPLIDGILGSIGGSLFGGARAAGGPVGAGKTYLVGEKGPELFVPGASGNIVPNGSSSSAPIAVNMTITSVDPQTAAQTIAGQERLITGMVRKAMIRAGARPQMA